MPTKERFDSLVARNGQQVIYHREDGGVDCPCLSPEGNRSPKWHKANPGAPVCNERGKINVQTVHLVGRAFIQPVQSGATRRLTDEYIEAMFGEVQVDDHIGIFPIQLGQTMLDFQEWSAAGEDYILYRNRRFQVVSANYIPDPDGGGAHHWEVGLRLIKTGRVGVG